ncbi:bifunctional phosphopantothenoylcysteine decarboxylase/phosphopantothenate--cysteine ligase CoaBC [Aeromicrobium camelliae]|uniref:Coenzyme A biosynthesis bifunctional protein CoaBC n=1 Tax=Aeromicrobium camelliae TaxID=1538144 RepID=A0A3N6ZKJ1_9ACTN|nr:bifunctional phosphopantothenoylcysteine decarboxylase/phosphopantothenate--cysteine ligase CoaBC [Aeromicrobium camelliae]RQN07547.1 bifunctional phosphopantothenoylcysteine decarboxylase/phosphopantothenate--cysteine ligase CoaBC [Aeromicrobium camelliae]
MSSIVLGVSGGVAAYKAALLLRLFTESGHDVRVVPTDSALNFVGAATWEALSGHPVQTATFDNVPEVPHVRIGQSADLVIVAPATANTLARAAQGLADDLLTNTLLTARCPVVFAPAMHTEMWEHPATQANVATLRERGAIVIDPAVGRLTGADSGAGRLPDPEDIYAVCVNVLAGRPRDLAGRRVVVSAGGTREFLDPVRFLGNRSSGRQGLALAEAAAARGAEVTLVAANVALPTPAGVERIDVTTTSELRDAVLKSSVGADAVVMAAAPADFRPATYADAKIKKRPDGAAPTIELVENPDILAELVRTRPADVAEPFIAGFAAETGDENGGVLDHARAKLARKGCDLLVVNDVSGGGVFGQEDNDVLLLTADGEAQPVGQRPKTEVAHVIWDTIVQRLG